MQVTVGECHPEKIQCMLGALQRAFQEHAFLPKGGDALTWRRGCLQSLPWVTAHFTHKPRAVTMKLWEPKIKNPKAVPRHPQNHVVWSRIVKCSVKSYVTGPSTKCYFNKVLFMWVLTHDKIEWTNSCEHLECHGLPVLFRPTSKRWFLNKKCKWSWICFIRCHVGIHVDFTFLDLYLAFEKIIYMAFYMPFGVFMNTMFLLVSPIVKGGGCQHGRSDALRPTYISIKVSLEVSLFWQIKCIFPSNMATCHAHIDWDPLVSHAKSMFGTSKDKVECPLW